MFAISKLNIIKYFEIIFLLSCFSQTFITKLHTCSLYYFAIKQKACTFPRSERVCRELSVRCIYFAYREATWNAPESVCVARQNWSRIMDRCLLSLRCMWIKDARESHRLEIAERDREREERERYIFIGEIALSSDNWF